MGAVYDLATVRPYKPDRKRYTPAEWGIYCEGYYRALAQALRVLQLACDRWMRSPMNNTLADFEAGRRQHLETAASRADARLARAERDVARLKAIVVVGVAVMLIWIGALIGRALQ